MNKYEAGFNLLMIFSIADGDFVPQEGKVIAQYLRKMHEPYVGTDEENKTLTDLSDDQLIDYFKDACYNFYKQHNAHERMTIFEGAARRFYQISLPHDRDTFIDTIKAVMVADQHISEDENNMINRLFKLWGLQ